MSRSDDMRRLTRECRAVLRGRPLDDPRLREHVDGCAICREWLRRRAALQRLLARPVTPPAALHAPEMSARIRERVVEQCEASPLGRALAQAMPVAPPQDRDAAWPEPLLATGLAARLGASPPAAVAARDWQAVRAAVLDDIADRAGRRTRRYRAFAGVGAAAALVLSVLVLRGLQSPPAAPEIVFTDVSALGDVGFTPIMDALRTGGQK